MAGGDGKARAKKLTPEQRREIARKAAQARWSQHSLVRLDTPHLDFH